ncbi:hypothetical protein QYE76_050969 [Lolium multiflorum]|uniref:Reverse transcriptase Ty1/copia-type domain-containing protein n=1 Tax=Lolium multiflorum TaxID=4521 RepID=A0AAD8SRY8_LOLMU|nr:hypothetical protein QYE76_050969 [Lolium multiflorum]
MDVSNAFLHGHLEEQVFCQQPTSFKNSAHPDHASLLSRSLYGLKQAPRAWYQRIALFLHQLGFRSTRSDASLFVTWGLRYFLRIEVVRRADGFFLHQRKYAHELLDRAGMLNCKPAATPIDTKAKVSATDGTPASDESSYRSIIGALQYLTLTRPELQHAVQQVCLHMHAPRDAHWTAVKRILRYIRGTMALGLTLHASTAWTSSPTRTLIGLATPTHGDPRLAKYRAVANAVAEVFWLRQLLGNNGNPITVHGSFARSDTCDREFQKIASKFGAKEELNAIDAAVDHTQPPADNRNEGALIEFLRERWEIFAWEPSDMPGIPRELAEHALNVDPTAKPVQQSMRRFSEPKRRAIGEEINRLRKAGFIRELKESEWVANPVMVPKKDTTALRMCIDYTGLNKHCPKDHFPLPRIDQIVDSTAGCDRLSFLDAYSGYNQIKLKKEYQELTTFITPHGVFCYNVMTFGLKNAEQLINVACKLALESRSGETSKSILTISW